MPVTLLTWSLFGSSSTYSTRGVGLTVPAVGGLSTGAGGRGEHVAALLTLGLGVVLLAAARPQGLALDTVQGAAARAPGRHERARALAALDASARLLCAGALLTGCYLFALVTQS